MSVVFTPIFAADTKIIFRYEIVASVKKITNIKKQFSQ